MADSLHVCALFGSSSLLLLLTRPVAAAVAVSCAQRCGCRKTLLRPAPTRQAQPGQLWSPGTAPLRIEDACRYLLRRSLQSRFLACSVSEAALFYRCRVDATKASRAEVRVHHLAVAFSDCLFFVPCCYSSQYITGRAAGRGEALKRRPLEGLLLYRVYAAFLPCCACCPVDAFGDLAAALRLNSLTHSGAPRQRRRCCLVSITPVPSVHEIRTANHLLWANYCASPPIRFAFREPFC